ncbi:hypothetical protein TKK_0010344 [Trichogramma kaykai]
MAQNQVKNRILVSVDWNSDDSRQGFLRELDSLIPSFNEIPNHRLIFQRGQIDRLLIDCLHCFYDGVDLAREKRKRFIQFVIRTGYTDEVEILIGPRTVQRVTAIHYAAQLGFYDLVQDLFKIYNQFGVNYSDRSGLTHFHAASMSGALHAVGDFISHGHDINCRWLANDSTPLHLALYRHHDKVADLLLQSAANITRPDAQGMRPAQLILARNYENPLVQGLFHYKRGFSLKFTLVSLVYMASLSVESCHIVVQNLTSKDWWNICLASYSLGTEKNPLRVQRGLK